MFCRDDGKVVRNSVFFDDIVEEEHEDDGELADDLDAPASPSFRLPSWYTTDERTDIEKYLLFASTEYVHKAKEFARGVIPFRRSQ